MFAETSGQWIHEYKKQRRVSTLGMWVVEKKANDTTKTVPPRTGITFADRPKASKVRNPENDLNEEVCDTYVLQRCPHALK